MLKDKVVIFLDIDEVLWSTQSSILLGGCPELDTISESYVYFQKESLAWLRLLVEHSGAVVVLCSTWRIGATKEQIDNLSTILRVPIVGMTGVMNITHNDEVLNIRGLEVEEFVGKYNVKKYVIIDDSSDFFLEQPLVQPHGLVGFNLIDAIKVVIILGFELNEFPFFRSWSMDYLPQVKPRKMERPVGDVRMLSESMCWYGLR